MTETHLSPPEALKAAAAVLGPQAAMARVCKVSQPSVWQWLNEGKALPAEHVIPVEEATEAKGKMIPRWVLRPDLYPPEEYQASAPSDPARGGLAASEASGSSPAGAAALPHTDPLEGLNA